MVDIIESKRKKHSWLSPIAGEEMGGGTMVQHKVPLQSGKCIGDGTLAQSHSTGGCTRICTGKSGQAEDRGAETVGVAGAGEQRLPLPPA
jgi:hypothetical protein